MRKILHRIVTSLFVLAGASGMVYVLWPDDLTLADALVLDIVRIVVATLAGMTSLAVIWSLWRD